MFEQEPINLIAGAIFIIVSASTRFNTPATNRSSTTAFRYYFGMLIYRGRRTYLLLQSHQFASARDLCAQG